VFMTAGAFVGIAFQPMYWFFIAMSISLRQYVLRVERESAAPVAVTGRWQGSAGAAARSSWRPDRIGQTAAVRPRTP
jgi:hypothetical protein